MFTNTQDIYDGIQLAEPLIGKWYLRVWSLLHSHLLLNCVHKYRDIYDGIGLLALNWEVVLERVESTPYLSPSELCSQIHKHLGWYKPVGP